MKSRILFLLLLIAGFNGVAQFSDPFEIEIDRNGTDVHLHIEIPADHYLYVDAFSLVNEKGHSLIPVEWPFPHEINDPNSGSPKQSMLNPFRSNSWRCLQKVNSHYRIGDVIILSVLFHKRACCK